MADQQELDPNVTGTESTAGQSGPASRVAEGKGKEKQPMQDVSMGEEDSDDEDESGAEGAVCDFSSKLSKFFGLLNPFIGTRAYVPTSIDRLSLSNCTLT